MASIFEDNLDEFHSALQLSIDSKIVDVDSKPNKISININLMKHEDKRWRCFQLITQGEWIKKGGISLYEFSKGSFNLNELTQFLFITRLRKENMIKIVEIHPEYKKYVEKVFPKSQLSSSFTIKTLEESKRIVFEEIARQNLTLNKLSHQTGLSMVSLSNFKAGKDIRLSTFLKITEVLGISFEAKILTRTVV